jgi:hypothetical protein
MSLIPLHEQLLLGEEDREWLENCDMEYPEQKVVFTKAADARLAFKVDTPAIKSVQKTEPKTKTIPVVKKVQDDQDDWLDDILG